MKKIVFTTIIFATLFFRSFASSDDGFSIKTGEYSLTLRWYLGYQDPNFYSYSTFWDLIVLFQQNSEKFDSISDSDTFQIYIKDDIYTLSTFISDSDIEFSGTTLYSILIQLRDFLVYKYSLVYEYKNSIRLYKLELPYHQSESIPIYRSEIEIGAIPGFGVQNNGNFITVYFDQDDVLITQRDLEYYDYSVTSKTVSKDNIDQFFFED